MRVRLSRRTLALSALLAATPGCSLLLVQGPPSGHGQMAAFSCTRSNAVPLLDAVVAGTSLLVGATLVAANAGDTGGWTAPYAVVGGGFVLEGLGFGASALVGFHRTGRCRAAQRADGAR
jgi:hypothetical protein